MVRSHLQRGPGSPYNPVPVALPLSSSAAPRDLSGSKARIVLKLALLKHVAKRTPNDAAVQKALVPRAEQMREWGEAVKAARRCALLDASPEARLSLELVDRARNGSS
jgi:hypothetical protein